MSNEKKPREFWVCAKKMEIEGFYYAEEKKIQRDLYPHYIQVPHYIHVIEYSAYEKLKEENEELKKQLEERDQVRLWNENEKLKEERDHWKKCFYILQDAKNESK